MANAGATYVDEDVHVDGGRSLLISSRDHDTVQQFSQALADLLPSTWA